MGMYVTKYIHEKHLEIRVIQIALPDAYVEHGNVSSSGDAWNQQPFCDQTH